MPPPNSKRKRTSESQSGRETPSVDKHAIFTQWAEDRGVKINGVEASHLKGRGLGLVTTKRIKADERILVIPEKAMFKPNQTLLNGEGLKDASPQAQLAMTAVLEMQGKCQAWENVLPTHIDFKQSMPMLSPESLRKLMPPPVHQPLERQLADYQRDLAAVEAVLEKHHFGEQDFQYWWLIVNSRSFHWKPPKGKGGVMVMCPFIDYMNHAPTGGTCNVTMTDEGYEVVADRDYASGEEILATYGSHSNDKLLVHYGFICSYTICYYQRSNLNPDDDIRLDHLIVPSLSEEVRSRLQDVGFLGGYGILTATNELCFKTQVAIRATLLTANEWEYFIENGEDLGEDRSLDVDKVVESLAVDSLQEQSRVERELRKLHQTPLVKTLLQRWDQIGSAFHAFSLKIYHASIEEEKKAKAATR